MTVLKCLITAGLVGVVVFAGPARGASAAQQATQSAAVTVDDSTLKSRINAILKKDASLAAHDLDVDVSQGVVTLKGTVRTAREKARAERVATITGVTQVRNEIVVDATVSPKSTAGTADRAAAKAKAGTGKALDETKKATGTAVDKTKEGTGKAIDATKEAGEKTADVTKDVARKVADKTKEIAGKTAEETKEIVGKGSEKSKEAASTTGEAVTDGWITTKVKAKFADETLLDGSDINVDTNDHVVTLKGTVTSDAAKARAAAIARGTKGVTRVVNQLVVK